MKKICKNCGWSNPTANNFCGSCGESLSYPLEKEAVNRRMTILFSDIVGSTPLSEGMDPEEWTEVLGAYHSICEDVIQKNHGHLAEAKGDGVVAYFGHQDAQEDDARNAIEAGLGIVKILEDTHPGEHQLKVRVGIDTGDVVVDNLQVGGRRDRRATGILPTKAERVQAKAAPNTVLITESTLEVVKGYFDFEDLGPQELKGVSGTTQLYRVVGSKGALSRLEAAETLGLTPFIGRDGEKKKLSESWERAQAGKKEVIELCGEPGIGKSRLVKFLKEQVIDQDDIFECRCNQYYQNSALYPLIVLLEEKIKLSGNDGPGERFQKLESWINRVELSDPLSVYLLADLLNIPKEGQSQSKKQEEVDKLTPQRKRNLTLKTLANIIEARTATGRLLFVAEDLHWADPSTLELIKMLMSLKDNTRILECLTYRPEFKPSWKTQTETTVLILDRLERRQSEEMVNTVAGNKALPTEVLQSIMTTAENVPLLLEEVTKATLESDVLTKSGNRYELDGKLPDYLVSEKVSESILKRQRGALTARIDRLGHTRHIARVAATLGREFSFKLLDAVSDLLNPIPPEKEVDLRGGLEQIEKAGLLIRQGQPPGATYAFNHTLIRNAAYDSLGKKTKQRYHKHIAERLKDRFPEMVKTQPELMATHYDSAGLLSEAIQFWQNAGSRDLERAALLESITHFEKALEDVKDLPKTEVQRKTVLEKEMFLQLAVMPAYMARWGWASQQVEDCCQRGIDLCMGLEDHETYGKYLLIFTWGLWSVHFLRANLDEAFYISQQVEGMAQTARHKLDLAKEAGVPVDNLIVAEVLMAQELSHHAVGFTCFYRSQFAEAEKHAREGIGLFGLEIEKELVKLSQASSKMILHYFLSASLWVQGKIIHSRQELEKATSLIENLDHKPSRALFMTLELFFYYLSRDPKGMKEAVKAMLELSHKYGYALYIPVASLYSGWALAQEGQLEEGLKQLEQGMAGLAKSRSKIKWVEVEMMHAETLLKADRIAEALDALAQGMAHADNNHEHLLESELYRLQGEILCRQGKEGDAVPILNRSIEMAHHQNALMLELRAVRSKTQIRGIQGIEKEAQRQLEELYHRFSGEGFDPKDLDEAKEILSEGQYS